MNIKCMHCEQVYNIQNGACPACGKRGGYTQEPKTKQIGTTNVHLEDVLVHSPSGNEYQVKEIQGNGLIAKCIKCILPQIMDKPVYISNTTIEEYKAK